MEGIMRGSMTQAEELLTKYLKLLYSLTYISLDEKSPHAIRWYAKAVIDEVTKRDTEEAT